MKRIPEAVAIVMLFVVAASGAVVTGSVSGRVVDGNGAALGGLPVTISGPAVERRTTTAASGAYLFAQLPPADYVVQAESQQSGTIIRTSVDVDAGRTTNVDFVLDRAPDETVTESRETALLDPQKAAFTTPWNPTELTLLPTGRHAAALLDRVPGIAVSLIDVGGSAFGGDLSPAVRGADSLATDWTIDGVRVTPASQLSTFGFGGVQQLAVTTAASDAGLRSYGGEITVVPRRGADDLSGFAAVFMADADFLGRPRKETREGMRLDRLSEVELGLGGQFPRDVANVFAAIGARDVARVAWVGGPVGADRHLHGYARADVPATDRARLGALFVGSESENGDSASLLKVDGAYQVGDALHLTAFAARVDDVRGELSNQGEIRGSYLVAGRVLQLWSFGVTADDAGGSKALFAGDSITFSRATVYAGIRADRITDDGDTNAVVAPRIAASLELPAERPTLLRLFAGRYAGTTGRDRADEFLVDIEQQLVPELTFGATATHRRFDSDSTSLNEIDAYVRKRLSNGFLVRGFVSWFDSERPNVPAISYALSAVAQLPRDMLFSFSWHGRQPTELDVSAASLDLRIGKVLSIDPFEATFALDLFNAAEQRAGSPRLLRLGVDLRF